MSDQDRDAQERDAQAGEYVIGTMPFDERADFERALARDPALRVAVRAWEDRLVPLNDLIAEIAPPVQTWIAIDRALGAPPAARAATLRADPLAFLRRSRARWRATAAVATALAAGLVLFIGTGQLGVPAASYLAVVNRGGNLPALVVQVDTRAGLVTVRPVAAETPTNRSLELWYIAATGGAPRSLGLVGGTRREAILPAVAREGDLAGATLAVSVEPVGGSKTGAPTGPVIYSGKLIKE